MEIKDYFAVGTGSIGAVIGLYSLIRTRALSKQLEMFDAYNKEYDNMCKIIDIQVQSRRIQTVWVTLNHKAGKLLRDNAAKNPDLCKKVYETSKNYIEKMETESKANEDLEKLIGERLKKIIDPEKKLRGPDLRDTVLIQGQLRVLQARAIQEDAHVQLYSSGAEIALESSSLTVV